MKILKTARSKNGFTLIEILVYFTLVSVILLIVVDLFIRISESSIKSTAKSEINIEGEYLIRRLAYDIRKADDIVFPANPGQDGNVMWLVLDGQSYIYRSDGTSMELLVTPSASFVDITSNLVEITGLTFRNIGGGKPTVKIILTLETTKEPKDGPETKNFETVISLRN